MMHEYTKSTEKLPEEAKPVWVRINGKKPRKMYRLCKWFFYYNKELFLNGNFSGISDNVLWRYCNE